LIDAIDHANETSVFAMESDGGVNKPIGLIFQGNVCVSVVIVDVMQVYYD
jgi:hypothetical protein